MDAFTLFLILFLSVFCDSCAFIHSCFDSTRTSFHVNRQVWKGFPMSIKVTCLPNESIEDTIKKFKRACNQSGHLMEMKFKEHWETAAEKKKRKKIRSRLLNKIERTNDRYERRAFGVSEYNS